MENGISFDTNKDPISKQKSQNEKGTTDQTLLTSRSGTYSTDLQTTIYVSNMGCCQ